MRRPTLWVCVALVVILAGCGGTGPGETPTGEPTTTAPGQTGPVEYSAVVFDGGGGEDPVIDGGLTLEDHPDTTYLGTLLTDESETDRFRRDALPDEAAALVDGTNFDNESLMVIQATPKSSVPDYRVESVTRTGDGLDVRINDSSRGGTDDITVETVLLRISHDGAPPSTATITTQDGVTFETDSGTEGE